MAIGQNGAVLRQVHRLFESGTLTGLSEPELLDRFVLRRDEAAFETLVTRHGPMVLGVCRRILFDPNDVDDAFQATFLVLVKKAGTLRDRTLLANWLYGVARHVSIKARAKSMRRRAFEMSGVDNAADVPERETPDHPLRPILDEELARLSERDRAAIVLCDLQGYSGDEAALALGLRAVTFRSRLHRARIKLKGRLTRRGLVAGALLEMASLRLSPSQALAEQTVKAAIAFAANPSAIGVVSISVATLTREVLTLMMLTKMKTATAIIVALGLVGTGVGVIAQEPAPNRPTHDQDRLRQVEQKLDRVLQALEGPRNVSADSLDVLPPPQPAHGPQAEPRINNRALSHSADVLATPPIAENSVRAPSADVRPVPTPGLTPPLNRIGRDKEPTLAEGDSIERLNRLERQLDSLEKRLRRLEQMATEREKPLPPPEEKPQPPKAF